MFCTAWCRMMIKKQFLPYSRLLRTQQTGFSALSVPCLMLTGSSRGSPWRTRRVLINLMENASKFTPPDGKLETGARQEGDWVHMWVKDNGPGIPAADQDRIFDKFTRLRGTNKPGRLGAGQGFCRLAVQGHGGRIWIESEQGTGSAFHFTFPVATEEQLTSRHDK